VVGHTNYLRNDQTIFSVIELSIVGNLCLTMQISRLLPDFVAQVDLSDFVQRF